MPLKEITERKKIEAILALYNNTPLDTVAKKLNTTHIETLKIVYLYLKLEMRITCEYQPLETRELQVFWERIIDKLCADPLTTRDSAMDVRRFIQFSSKYIGKATPYNGFYSLLGCKKLLHDILTLLIKPMIGLWMLQEE